LPGIETLDPETARSLLAFADAGGKVVLIGKRPAKSAAYVDAETSDAAVKEAVDAMLKRSDGTVFEYPAPGEDPISWYGKMQDDLGIEPYIRFSKSHKYLSQSSYLLGTNPMFFLANTCLYEDIALEAEFQVGRELTPWIWNPETGERYRYASKDSPSVMNLLLPRASSLLIVFEDRKEGEPYKPLEPVNGGREIKGPWMLNLQHVNGTQEEMELEEPTDLLDIPGLKDFAGIVYYETNFHSESGDTQLLDLGQVQGISELTLNGTSLGTRWFGAHVYDLSGKVKEGENHLSVKVTTIVGNYVKSLNENPVAQRWTRHQEYYPMGMLGPVRLGSS
jgi:hypothetical protein